MSDSAALPEDLRLAIRQEIARTDEAACAAEDQPTCLVTAVRWAAQEARLGNVLAHARLIQEVESGCTPER